MKTRLFFPPDNDNTGGASPAPTPAVAAADSPTGQDIPTAPAREQKPAEIVQPKPVVKQPGIVDVKKALGLEKKPSEMNTAEAKRIADASKSSVIVPTPKIRSRKIAEEKEGADAAPETPVVTPEAKEPTETPEKAPEPVKVKIGDREMTADEVAKYVADLESKTKPPEQPKEQKAPEPTLTPEAKAAQEKQRDEEAIGKLSQEYATGITENELDTILSGGPDAAKLFAAKLATTEFKARKWAEAAINPILKDLNDRLDPVLKMHSEVAQYQAEANFHAKPENAPLAGHRKTVRMIAQTLREKYPAEYGAMSEAERETEIRTHALDFIKNFNVQPDAATPAASPNAAVTPPVVQVPVAPVTPKPSPKPPTGQLSLTGAPSAQNTQASMVAKLEAFRKTG